jgi:hypothetical protein
MWPVSFGLQLCTTKTGNDHVPLRDHSNRRSPFRAMQYTKPEFRVPCKKTHSNMNSVRQRARRRPQHGLRAIVRYYTVWDSKAIHGHGGSCKFSCGRFVSGFRLKIRRHFAIGRAHCNLRAWKYPRSLLFRPRYRAIVVA